jgi:3-deoxy-D-manno-octulosonate 8-phosphate phosphatase (KDO 8-P phosphatase)
MTPEERARRVRLLMFDVDGVLTDGTVVIHSDGSESKGFNIRDGAALVWAQRAGLTVGLLSARTSGATAHRAAQLAIRLVRQGVSSKVAAYNQILTETGVDDAAVGYMGDDLVDLPVFARVGLAAAPSDAAAEVTARAHWVSAAPGGRGAVREFVEMVLRAQDKWERVVAQHAHAGDDPPAAGN